MPVALSYPGVYIEEVPSGVRTITGVATSITAFVGRALRGPVDSDEKSPARIFSFADFERIFGGLSNADQLSMIHSTLAMEHLGADYAITLADTYFSQDTRAIWEFTKLQALAVPGATPDQVNGEFDRMEEALMAKRNRSWIPVIKAAAADGPVFAAFGALHLSGKDGVLALLERDGYTVARLSIP